MRSLWWNRRFFDFFAIFQNSNAFLKYFGNVSKNFFFSNQSITSKMLMLNKKFKEFEGRDFLNRHFTGKIAFIELLTRRMSCDQCVDLGLSFIVVFELTKFIACVKSYARLKSILFAHNSRELNSEWNENAVTPRNTLQIWTQEKSLRTQFHQIWLNGKRWVRFTHRIMNSLRV